MKAITTKYSGPAHMNVTDGDSRMRLPYPHEIAGGIEARHMWAACEFARRKGWKGTLAQGLQRQGVWVHVFIDGPWAVVASIGSEATASP